VRDPGTIPEDSGTTTVVAALVVFFLGAINFHGYRVVAVALGDAMTVLLHFKSELEQFSQKLTPRDIRSMLQFAALSAVILPLLPDRSFGPYGVLNPFHIWLMVVLIAGISLAGYVAGADAGRHAAAALGGVVSSTATAGLRASRRPALNHRRWARHPARERYDAGASVRAGRDRCARRGRRCRGHARPSAAGGPGRSVQQLAHCGRSSLR
jgi:uncharacterized membrane protein (DUF4010 family)